MGRKPTHQTVKVLHIGRVDPNHESLWQQLQREGVDIAFARTQAAGLQTARDLQPQIVIINTANSHFSGDRLCRTLGRRLPGAQRLLIVVDRTAGLNVPCEKRLAQPFTVRKLRETVTDLLKAASPHTIVVDPLTLDLVSQTVAGPNGRHHLTPKQCNLLAIFMQHPNQVISRKDLMARVWETGYLGDTRTLDVHIRWLREKIELDPNQPSLLLTKRGIGYTFLPPETSPDSEDN